MIQPILASLVETGDRLTDREGKYSRLVVDVDPFSNVHGKIIIRTAPAGGQQLPHLGIHGRGPGQHGPRPALKKVRGQVLTGLPPDP